MSMQITIRDVDEKIFREFKADAVRKGMTLGTAINFAMQKFRAELTKKRPLFTQLVTPFDGGKGSEHVSEEVDSIMYGE
ncbi:MAG: hypothetical protein Q7R76_04000 [Candidatus Woesearchaeota archaeon]|nr:hypothetical protein [Candidatus Woesearchaeota archaeon]